MLSIEKVIVLKAVPMFARASEDVLADIAALVEEVQVGCEQRNGDCRLIEIDADRFLHARLVAHDLPGTDAAYRDLALSRRI